MGSKKVTVIDDSVEEKKDQVNTQKRGKERAKVENGSHLFKAGKSDEDSSTDIPETDLAGPPSGGAEFENQEQASELKDEVSVEQEKSEPRTKTTSKEKKESRGQKFLKVKALVDPSKKYTLNEAIDLAKQTSYTKFDGTIEAHFNIKSKGFRTSMTLPHPVKGQKEKKMLIFADGIGDLAAKNPNIMAGNKQTVEKILSGELIPGRDFQMVIATPAFMVDLAGVAKTLGPKGLMPNPKNGTITDDVEKTLKSFAGGQIEVKGDPTAPIVHLAVGKVSWEAKNVEENIDAATNAVGKNSIVKLTLNATMGPGIVVTL